MHTTKQADSWVLQLPEYPETFLRTPRAIPGVLRVVPRVPRVIPRVLVVVPRAPGVVPRILGAVPRRH